MHDDLWEEWDDLVDKALQFEARLAKETGANVLVIPDEAIVKVESALDE